MSNPEPSTGPAPSSAPGRTALLLLLLATLAAGGFVLWLMLRPQRVDQDVVEEVLEGREAAALEVNRSDVIDALGRADVKPREGWRYRVRITDESREGAAGVTRIGGLVTFVPNARKGDVLVVEVTRLKRTSAEAAIVRREEAAPAAPEPAPPPRRPAPARAGSPVEVGKTYRAVVTDVGSKGDGIAHVGGKVVFVPEARRGEDVEFRIVEDLDRFARGELVSSAATGGGEVQAQASDEARADDVAEGRVFDVVVSEKDRKNPDRNGVARIGGLVVFVPGSQPGDRVRIRIVERKSRFAVSEIVSRMPGEEAAP